MFVSYDTIASHMIWLQDMIVSSFLARKNTKISRLTFWEILWRGGIIVLNPCKKSKDRKDINSELKFLSVMMFLNDFQCYRTKFSSKIGSYEILYLMNDLNRACCFWVLRTYQQYHVVGQNGSYRLIHLNLLQMETATCKF